MFENKNFESHSGELLLWKIECDDLTDSDIECLTEVIASKIEFANAIGVPGGGLRLANSLKKYENHNLNICLIVDDVLTTGKSMEEMKAQYPATAYPEVIGVVIFARNPTANWIRPIFQLSGTFSDN